MEQNLRICGLFTVAVLSKYLENCFNVYLGLRNVIQHPREETFKYIKRNKKKGNLCSITKEEEEQVMVMMMVMMMITIMEVVMMLCDKETVSAKISN